MHLHRLGLLRAALLALACALPGCGGGSGGNSPSPDVGVGTPAPQTAVAAGCAGANLSGLQSVVYVSSQGSDGAGCGATTAAACRTIEQGIANCAAAGCGVLVRHGLYPTAATIALRNAVSVYGSCVFDGEPDRRYRSVIQAGPAPGTPALSVDGVDLPTTVSGLVVLGKNESANGTASIALTVSNSKALVLSGNVLAAGRGGAGAPGSRPAPAATGEPGGTASTYPFTAGGQGQGGPSCDQGGAGRGGDGSAWQQNSVSRCFLWCECNSSGGTWGSVGGKSGSIAGGSNGGPGYDDYGCVGLGGPAGQGRTAGPGFAGACSQQSGSASANVWGALQSTTWSPGAGGSGAAGAVGSGGGGGGAGGLCAATTNGNHWFPYWGQPGGGGGAGGCAGSGGPGGQQGGASIGVVLFASSVDLAAASNAILAGPGGSGGSGAPGGVGGSGGPAGAGGSFNPACSEYNANDVIGWGGLGGAGGAGGSGGAGSGGAGGNGGPSIGIALAGASSVPDAAGIYPVLPGAGGGSGAGGQGGADNCSGATGVNGVAGGGRPLLDYDEPLGSILLAGQQLAKGQSIYSPDGKVELLLQPDDNFCLYAAGNALWCTATNGEGIPAVLMQANGNLCLYPTDGSQAWCSGTAGHPNAYLIVQDGGHLQIIDGNSVLWSKP